MSCQTFFPIVLPVTRLNPHLFNRSVQESTIPGEKGENKHLVCGWKPQVTGFIHSFLHPFINPHSFGAKRKNKKALVRVFPPQLLDEQIEEGPVVLSHCCRLHPRRPTGCCC